ncbi:MAG TPA: hypothetical protein VMY43_10735 [Methanothrix sp.]|nr:hypothetical protein [Methanothrix sp.]
MQAKEYARKALSADPKSTTMKLNYEAKKKLLSQSRHFSRGAELAEFVIIVS